MQYQQGAQILTADGQDVGKVDRLVIEPGNRQVTRRKVRKGVLLPGDQFIPIDQVRDVSADEITFTSGGRIS